MTATTDGDLAAVLRESLTGATPQETLQRSMRFLDWLDEVIGTPPEIAKQRRVLFVWNNVISQYPDAKEFMTIEDVARLLYPQTMMMMGQA